MLGNFHDNVINIECETNSADLYVVDAEGVYIENIAMHSYLESDVIDAINAKYGTNFTHLTMLKVTGIAIGDDCTNWNAYEKIGLPPNMLYKYKNPINQVWFFGEVENANAKIYGEDENTYFVLNDAGSIIGKNSANVDMLKDEIKTAIEAKISESLQSISIVSTSYQMGNTVDNWDDYEIV